MTPTVLAVGWTLTIGAQVLLIWWLAGLRGRWRRIDERIGRFGEALALLTEANESGFRAVAAEIERGSGGPARVGAARRRTRRIARAAKVGRSLADIAASEQMSEGEVRLRLHLADHPFAGSDPAAR